MATVIPLQLDLEKGHEYLGLFWAVFARRQYSLQVLDQRQLEGLVCVVPQQTQME